jgi:peptide/nickel transport system substrate-binding protein
VKKLLIIFTIISMVLSMSVPNFAQGENIIKMGVIEEPDSLNPLVAYERAAFETFMIIYDSLITFDSNLEPQLNLAESYVLSDDMLTWTFKLKEGIKWSDGEPFTSKDIKFTYELIRDTGLSLYYDMVRDIIDIQTPDDNTIIFVTELPKANMLQNITPILPEHIWSSVSEDEYETFENSSPVGTGPFIVQEWKKNEYLSLKANKDYFKGAPSSDGFIFSMYANRDTMAQSLKLGEIDIALGLYNNQAKTLLEDEGIERFVFSENGFTELAYNCNTDPSSAGSKLILDKTIRQAIEYAIDKQKIIDMVYEGAGQVGTSLIPISQTQYHYEPTGDELKAFNPEKANAILDDAGYLDIDNDGIRESKEGNEKLSFIFLLRTENSNEVKAGQMIKSYLNDIGIETLIETIDDGALNDRIFGTTDFDMFIWGWGGDVDPSTMLRILTTDQIGNLNDVYYSNTEYDEIVNMQSTIMDQQERTNVIIEAQKILYDELPYSILMYENELQLYRSDKIEGITPTKAGAIFYADTPLNYINAKVIGSEPSAPSTEEKTDDNTSTNNLYYIAGGLLLVVGLGLFIIKSRKAKKDW